MHNILLDPHHYILCLISKLMHLMLGKSCRQIIVCIGKNNLCRPFRTKVWLDVFGNWSSAELCINMYMLLMLLYILFIGYWFEYWLWMDFKYFSNKGFKYFWQWNLPPGVESISVLRIAKKKCVWIQSEHLHHFIYFQHLKIATNVFFYLRALFTTPK